MTNPNVRYVLLVLLVLVVIAHFAGAAGARAAGRLVNVSRPCADNLEDTMKEAVERDHDPVNNVPGPTDEAKGDPGLLLQAARRLELAGGGDEDEPDDGDEPDEDDDEDAPESPPAPEPAG